MGKIYGIYAEKHDITFIMKDIEDANGNIETTEVIGFVYGNEVDNKILLNSDKVRLKTEFTLEKTEIKNSITC